MTGVERLSCWIVTYPTGTRKLFGSYPTNLERHSLGEVSTAWWPGGAATDNGVDR